jgi:hypothetical protein
MNKIDRCLTIHGSTAKRRQRQVANDGRQARFTKQQPAQICQQNIPRTCGIASHVLTMLVERLGACRALVATSSRP